MAYHSEEVCRCLLCSCLRISHYSTRDENNATVISFAFSIARLQKRNHVVSCASGDWCFLNQLCLRDVSSAQ